MTVEQTRLAVLLYFFQKHMQGAPGTFLMFVLVLYNILTSFHAIALTTLASEENLL